MGGGGGEVGGRGRLLIFRFFPDLSPELIRIPRLLIFKEWWCTDFLSVAELVFLFM